MIGFINAAAVVGLDTTMAVVLARSGRRAWNERKHGLVNAVQAGLTPGLIGLAGAVATHGAAGAVVRWTIFDPALTSAEPDRPPSSR